MSDEQRYSQHLEQRKTAHAKELRDLEESQNNEITTVVDRFKKEKEEIEKSFKVSLSEESKHQAEILEKIRSNHNEEYSKEKKKFDTEFEKMNVRERQRVENYQKKQEENISRLHDRFQIAKDEMKKQNDEA